MGRACSTDTSYFSPRTLSFGAETVRFSSSKVHASPRPSSERGAYGTGAQCPPMLTMLTAVSSLSVEISSVSPGTGPMALRSFCSRNAGALGPQLSPLKSLMTETMRYCGSPIGLE